MQVKIHQQFVTSFETPFEFPIYRTRLHGEYGCAGFKKEYWKFESIHKVTKITEEICQTTILTYDDENADFFLEMVTKDMLYGVGEYNTITEAMYDRAIERLIDKLFNS